jgi:hypothetical protein
VLLRRQVLSGVAGGALAGLAVPVLARAQPASSGETPLDSVGDEALKALYGDREAAQPLMVIYSTAGTGQRFTLDRSQPDVVLMKFEEQPEVWALRSSFGVRGDEFLRNDVGATMLRITSLGGATLYVDGDTAGAPASVEGRGQPIARPRASHRTLQLTVEAALPRLQRLLPPGALRIEASGVLPLALVEEAYAMVALALGRLPPRWFQARPHRLTRIRCVRARRTSARFRNGYLELGLVPGSGHAGRPSSLAIRNGLMGTRGIPN